MTMNEQWIRQRIEEHREVLRQMETQLPQVAEAAAVCREALEKVTKFFSAETGAVPPMPSILRRNSWDATMRNGGLSRLWR